MVTPLMRALAASTLFDVGALEVVLIRHGQQLPFAQRVGARQHVDPPLSDLGRRQAEAVARELAGERIDAVYSSDLDRALATGHAIASQHGLEPEVRTGIREVDLRAKLPEGVSLADFVAGDGFAEAAERFVITGRWSDLPMSEPGDEFRARVVDAMEAVIGAHPEGRIVVACHGGVVNAYVAELLGVTRDYWFRTAHCSVTRVLVLGDERRVYSLNETHHLRPDLFSS